MIGKKCLASLGIFIALALLANQISASSHDYLPLVLSDFGNITAITPDGDQNWSFSINATESEILPINFSSTGNVNNTVYFSVDGDLANSSIVSSMNFTTNLSLDDSQAATFNITINESCPIGTYSGNLTWTSANDTSQSENITIGFTVSITGVANIEIQETSWSAAFQAGSSASRTFTINNTGTYNATACNMSYSASAGSASFNASNFVINQSDAVSVSATFSGSSAGSDSTAYVIVECLATASGGVDLDTVVGSISISAADDGDDGGGGGGGGGSSDPVCGNGICEVGETAESCAIDCTALTTNITIGLSPEFASYFLSVGTFSKWVDVKNPNAEDIVVKIYAACLPNDPSCEWLSFHATDNGTSIDGTEIYITIPEGNENYPTRYPVLIRSVVPEGIESKAYQANVIFEAPGVKKSFPFSYKTLELLGPVGVAVVGIQNIWDIVLIGPWVNPLPLIGYDLRVGHVLIAVAGVAVLALVVILIRKAAGKSPIPHRR